MLKDQDEFNDQEQNNKEVEVESNEVIKGGQLENETKVMEQNEALFDHKQIGQYANQTLQVEEELPTGTKLRIIGTDERGSTFTKYTVYVIKGQDKNGEINVSRRFNQFFQLRTALVKRWPGCFIPSIPSKNFVKKNDKDMVLKRERYLNDFLIKMSKLPHLYLSEEFQTFIRSNEPDVSTVYKNWPNPTFEAIINKYRDNFNNLEGKTINQTTSDQIAQFYASIKKNQALLEKYRAYAKELAIARDNYNGLFPRMISLIIPTYQKTCLVEYANGRQQNLIYLNSSQAKLSEHARMCEDLCKRNPYWLLYDLIKNEERDGRAFIQALSTRQTLQGRRVQTENKMKSHQKSIQQALSGKKMSKGTSQEMKYRLQTQLEEMKKQRQKIINLSDIINALTVYVEIKNYQTSKVKFYHDTMRRLGGFEIGNAQISAEIWSGVKESAKKVSLQSKIKY